MISPQQIETVARFRSEPISGLTIDFEPLSEDNLSDVVFLRNQDHARYYLNQQSLITCEDQRRWYESYVNRNNDLYWCIVNKNHEVVGTVRLYDITEKSCEHGSFIIGEQYTMGTPYALEAMIMSLQFGFESLRLEYIECNDKADNANMNSISKRFGFKFINQHNIGGLAYNHYILYRDECKTDKYIPVLHHYVERDTI